jgi:hypothetical protein
MTGKINIEIKGDNDIVVITRETPHGDQVMADVVTVKFDEAVARVFINRDICDPE